MSYALNRFTDPLITSIKALSINTEKEIKHKLMDSIHKEIIIKTEQRINK
jgi:hypothetical protein